MSVRHQQKQKCSKTPAGLAEVLIATFLERPWYHAVGINS